MNSTTDFTAIDPITGLPITSSTVRSSEDSLKEAIAAQNSQEQSNEIDVDLGFSFEPLSVEKSESVVMPLMAADLSDISLTKAKDSSSKSKTLMLVGGGWQYPATKDPYGVSIYLDFLERAGGVEDAKIGIFTTASSTPRRNGKYYVQDFEDLYNSYLKDEYPNQSIDVEWIPFTINNQEKKKNSEAFADSLKEYTGFIFGGGDQSVITESFFNEDPKKGTRTVTPVLRALKRQFNNGAVIAGTSAGTAVQTGKPMITEGESFEALAKDPISLIGSPPLKPELYYNPLGGLNLFKYGLLDTHFSERGRQGRIIRLSAESGQDVAYGVDENTALIVSNIDTPNVKMEVLGENGVFISDVSDARVKDKKYWSISGVNTTYITEGDKYDPLTNTARFPDKSRFRGTLDTQPKSRNIFSRKNRDGDWTDPREFTETAIDLFESKSAIARGKTRETDPIQYQVTLEKTKDSKGFRGFDGQDVERFSFANLSVDIGPIL